MRGSKCRWLSPILILSAIVVTMGFGHERRRFAQLRRRGVIQLVSSSDGRITIPVRFTNTPSGDDVVAQARPGEVLLNVADRSGVTIARGCKTGLCGACTADLADPAWTAAAHLVAETAGGGREGFQVIRACSTRVTLLPGQDEMMIDVYRSSSKTSHANQTPGTQLTDEEQNAMDLPIDPMARFGENWETEFVPDYKKFDASKNKNEDHLPSVSSGVAPWDHVW